MYLITQIVRVFITGNYDNTLYHPLSPSTTTAGANLGVLFTNNALRDDIYTSVLLFIARITH